jgi:hypothetical protein
MTTVLRSALILAIALGWATSMQAQTIDTPWRVTFFPAGSLVGTEGDQPTTAELDSFTLGGSVSFALSRFFSIEGELSGGVGREQDLEFGNGAVRADSPSTLLYNANLVFNTRDRRHTVVPYLTGGLGGVTLFSESALGIDDTEHRLAGNVGGGLAFTFGRWGVRGDYRLFVVDGADDAATFLGGEARYAHRVYGGLTVDLGPSTPARGSRR